jgi:hypothetical protein
MSIAGLSRQVDMFATDHWDPEPMERKSTVTALLAELIQQDNVPLKAVALAGEIITIDARLSDFEPGSSRRTSLETWSAVAEAYVVLLKRAHSVVAEFAQKRDGHVLVAGLSAMKNELAAL